MLNQKKLIALSFGELTERFSYYGAQAILILYLTKIFSLSDQLSYSIFGIFITLSFTMPLLGGIIADKWIGNKNALIYGSLLLIIGNLLATSQNTNIFYLGLATIICGTGLYKPNCTGSVGRLYSSDDQIKKENAFRMFYMFMSIGGMLGPILYGIINSKISWHSSFIFSAALVSLSLISFLYTFKSETFNDNHKTKIIDHLKISALIVLLCFIVTLAILHSSITKYLVEATFLIAIACLLTLGEKENIGFKKVISLLVLFIFMMLFFAASLQVLSSISLFIERNINRDVFGYTIPTVMFSALYPMAVIILAPLCTHIVKTAASANRNITATHKVCFSLVFACLAFIFFFLAAKNTSTILNHYLPILWICLGNLCLGAGEILLMPTMFNEISKNMPASTQGTMMGLLFVFIAFSGYFSSQIAKLSDVRTTASTTTFSIIHYEHFFVSISSGVFLAAILLFIINKSNKHIFNNT